MSKLQFLLTKSCVFVGAGSTGTSTLFFLHEIIAIKQMQPKILIMFLLIGQQIFVKFSVKYL